MPSSFVRILRTTPTSGIAACTGSLTKASCADHWIEACASAILSFWVRCASSASDTKPTAWPRLKSSSAGADRARAASNASAKSPWASDSASRALSRSSAVVAAAASASALSTALTASSSLPSALSSAASNSFWASVLSSGAGSIGAGSAVPDGAAASSPEQPATPAPAAMAHAPAIIQFRIIVPPPETANSVQCYCRPADAARGKALFWSGGCGETGPPIDEVGPTIVFEAAFDGDRALAPAFDQRNSVSCLLLAMMHTAARARMHGARRSRLFGRHRDRSVPSLEGAFATLGTPSAAAARAGPNRLSQKIWDAPIEREIPKLPDWPDLSH